MPFLHTTRRIKSDLLGTVPTILFALIHISREVDISLTHGGRGYAPPCSNIASGMYCRVD